MFVNRTHVEQAVRTNFARTQYKLLGVKPAGIGFWDVDFQCPTCSRTDQLVVFKNDQSFTGDDISEAVQQVKNELVKHESKHGR